MWVIRGSLVFVLAFLSEETKKKVFACVGGGRKKLRAPLSPSLSLSLRKHISLRKQEDSSQDFPESGKEDFFLFFFENRTFAGNGRVLSRDEMGPIEIIAHFGAERRFHLRVAAEENSKKS